jgi:hypothetical protein
LALGDLAYTLQVGRDAMESRLALVVRDLDELVRGLKCYLAQGLEQRTVAMDGPPIPIFTGHLDEEGSGLDLLLGGSLGEDLLRLLLAEPRLERLALYWAKGGKVPWAALHQDGPVRVMSLPSYPFARERYWVQADPAHPSGAEQHLQAGATPAAGDGEEPGLGAYDPAVKTSETGNFSVEPARSVAENLQRYLIWFMGRETGLTPGQIKPAKGLHSYGVDSIISARLMRGLETYFQVRVTGRELLAHGSIESLVGYLAGKAEAMGGSTPTTHPASVKAIEARAAYMDAQVIEALEQLERGALDLDAVQRIIGD